MHACVHFITARKSPQYIRRNLNGIIATRLASVDLTPNLQCSQTGISCTSPYGEVVWRVAHTFLALRKCLSDLDLYYGGIHEGPAIGSGNIHHCVPAPHFKSSPTDEGQVQITYRCAKYTGGDRYSWHL